MASLIRLCEEIVSRDGKNCRCLNHADYMYALTSTDDWFFICESCKELHITMVSESYYKVRNV